MTGRVLDVDYGYHENGSRRYVQLASGRDVIYAPERAHVQVYHTSSGDVISTLQGHFTTVNCCLYDDSRQELYSGGNDRNILVFSADSATELRYKEHLESSGEKNEWVNVMSDAWSDDDDDDDDD